MHAQLSAAIAAAHPRDLDGVARILWRTHAAGLLDDDQAQGLAELIEARRSAARTPAPAPAGLRPGRWSYFPKRPPQRSPDRQRSIERRRRLAASGPMPPTLACRFTTGELAVLRIVADEVRDRGGRCSRTIGEIAARAGVCISTAKNAIRTASRLGLLTVEERRQHCRPNLANVVRVISREWLAWISKGIGVKKFAATDRKFQSQPAQSPWNAPPQASARPG